MFRTYCSVWSIVVVAAFLLTAPSPAADSGDVAAAAAAAAGSVTGTGTVVIEHQPQLLRGQFVITADDPYSRFEQRD